LAHAGFLNAETRPTRPYSRYFSDLVSTSDRGNFLRLVAANFAVLWIDFASSKEAAARTVAISAHREAPRDKLSN